MLRRIAAVAAGVVLATTAAPKQDEDRAGAQPRPSTVEAVDAVPGCSRTYTRRQFRRKAKGPMRSPMLTRRRYKRLRRLTRCARPTSSRRLMRRDLAAWKRWRREAGRWVLAYARIPTWGKAWLSSTASCESHGNPGAHSGTGKYHGKYQFSLATASAAGFVGDPHLVSEREQDVRAYRWMQRAGTNQWPECG